MLRYLPPTLLVVVAALQMTRAAVQHELTPSKGGGFGMFATIDKYENRHARLRVDGQPIALHRDEAAFHALQDAVSAPTTTHLNAALQLVSTSRSLRTGQVLVLEIYGPEFDRTTGMLRRKRLSTRALTVGP